MNASLFFPHLHSLFIVFFVGGLTLRNFGGAKLRITRHSLRVNHRLENPPTPWGTEPPNVGFHSPRCGGISGGAKRHDTSVIYQ